MSYSHTFNWLRLAALTMLIALVFGAMQARAQEGGETLSAEGMTAEEAVQDYIDSLFARLEQVRSYYDSDRERYFQEITEALERFVDFREVARGVMAKYSTGSRGATDAQLDRFAEVFKTSLVDFYGSALTSYGGQEYEIREGRESDDPAQATLVGMRLKGEDGGQFEMQYTMFLDDDERWQLKNVYVEGVNLRRQYHSQFDSLMKRYDYDIDAVIENWDAQVNR